ncbi:hypothetical protein DRQ00_09075 [candidate division KSB1 bacterium]|nr:MAG: hypothetical protein DRQ00_09075 [candidate division KSB1 bacterium]
MAIRRKDGSVYKLRGPNKLLTSQEFWSQGDKLLTHNFDRIAKIIIDTPTPAIQPPSKPALSAGLDGFKPQEELKQEPLKTAPVGEKVSIPPEDQSPFRSHDRCWLYCLPANVSKVMDRLYEEDYVRIQYKDPFRFQGAIVGSSDVRMAFWTTVEHITPRSIIFHPDTRRWWEVQDVAIENTNDGIVYTCVPSSTTPDFSSLVPV